MPDWRRVAAFSCPSSLASLDAIERPELAPVPSTDAHQIFTGPSQPRPILEVWGAE